MIRNLGNLNLAAPSDRYVAPARPRRIKMLLQMLGGKHNLATHRNVPKDRRRSLPIKIQLKSRACLETSIGLAIGVQRREHLLTEGFDGTMGLFPGTVESKDFGRLVELDAGPSLVMLILVAIGTAGSVPVDLNVETTRSFLDDHFNAFDDAVVLVGQNVKPCGRVPALLLFDNHVRPLQHGGVVLEVDAELFLLLQDDGIQAQRQAVVIDHPLKISLLDQLGIGTVARRDAKQRIGHGRHGFDPEKVHQSLEQLVGQIDKDMPIFVAGKSAVPPAGELGGQHGILDEAQRSAQDGYLALSCHVQS